MHERAHYSNGTSLVGRVWAAFLRPVDALPIDLFRVCVGLVLIVYFFRTLMEVNDFSGPDGLLDHSLILKMYWFTEIGIFRTWMGVEWFYAAFSIAIACCLPLILGYRVKLFSLILYVIAISTYRRNFLVMYVDDSIMHLLLFWMLLMPVGRTLVLGEWLRDRSAAWERWKFVKVPGATLRLFFWNLTLLYLVAGLWKWTSPMWLDGSALYVVFKLPISYFHDYWGTQHIPVLRVFNYVTLVLEPLVPLMFVLPRWSRLKVVMLFAFLGLHLGSVATLNIPFANFACAATVILMFREELMQMLRGGYREFTEQRSPATFGLSGAFALFMVTTLTLAMVSSVSLINWRTATREHAKQSDQVLTTTEAEHQRQLTDGRNEGLRSMQMVFFGTLWIIGIAQQYQLFNWIDDRNYSTKYSVTVDNEEVDPDDMFQRSLRGVLLDFYIHDITWMRVASEDRAKLRESILERTANRYCREYTPRGQVKVYSSIHRVDPKGGDANPNSILLMEFSCGDRDTAVFIAGP